MSVATAPMDRLAAAAEARPGPPVSHPGGSWPVDMATPSGPRAILARGLGKRFGRRWVLDAVDVELAPGGRLALFGPNGAGKTTLLRLLATAMRPTSGRLWIGGVDAAAAPADARRQIGFVAHQTYLYPDLNAGENLRFFGRMFGVPYLEAAIHAALARVGLLRVGQQPVRTLSRGMQQRLALARATLHAPPLLLLDEPETGLDAEAALQLPALLGLEHEGGRPAGYQPALVLATHHHDLGQALCQRVLSLQGGRVAGGGSTAR